MNTFKLHHWTGLFRKFDQLARPQVIARATAVASGELLGVSPGREAATIERGPRSKSTKKHALTRSSSSASSDHYSRGVVGVLATPLRFFARLLFSDVRLIREGKNLGVKLATKQRDAQHPAPIDKALAEALPMRAALKTLLDSHPKSRRVMRHLAFFEGTLATHGVKATAQVPIEVLSVAVEQLETLVSNWSNRGLAELRSRMAVAIIDRSRDPFYGATGDKLSNFNTDSRLLVGDVSHSMFQELERQYQDLLPAQSIEAVLDPIGVQFGSDVPTASGAGSR